MPISLRNPRAKSIPGRIVVRGTNWVGDTVMSLPAMREVRRIFPEATIAVWVPSSVSDLVQAAGIADQIISFDKNPHGSIARPFRMIGKIGGRRFDMALLFQNAFEAAFTATLARIPLRAGYPTDLRGPLLNIRVPLDPQVKQKHQVFYYLAITDFLEQYFLGRNSAAGRIPDCSVLIGLETFNRARDLLQDGGLELDRPMFCLCPGSVNSEAKRWPEDYFARLADLLARGMDAQMVFMGAPAERDLIETIRSMTKKSDSINLAQRGDIATAMAIMYMSRMVISNDTGSAHLAVAASAKVLTLFGPTSAGQTAPFGPNAHIIEGSAPCAPCRHFRCPVEGHPCMRSIKPEEVYEKIQVILS